MSNHSKPLCRSSDDVVTLAACAALSERHKRGATTCTADIKDAQAVPSSGAKLGSIVATGHVSGENWDGGHSDPRLVFGDRGYQMNELTHRLNSGVFCSPDLDFVDGRKGDARHAGQSLNLTESQRRQCGLDALDTGDVGFHADSLPHSVCLSQPHSVTAGGYRIEMENLKKIVRANVLALIATGEGGPLKANETGVTRLVKKGFTNGTAQRILDETTSIGIDVIEALAVAFKVQPWQLMTRELDPKSLPALIDQPGAWPFEFIDQRQYTNMPQKVRVFVQGRIKQVLDEHTSQQHTDSTAQFTDLGNASRAKQAPLQSPPKSSTSHHAHGV